MLGQSKKVGFLVTSIGRPGGGGRECAALVAAGLRPVPRAAASCTPAPATLRGSEGPSVTRKVCHTGRRERHAARARSGEIPERGMLDR